MSKIDLDKIIKKLEYKGYPKRIIEWVDTSLRKYHEKNYEEEYVDNFIEIVLNYVTSAVSPDGIRQMSVDDAFDKAMLLQMENRTKLATISKVLNRKSMPLMLTVDDYQVYKMHNKETTNLVGIDFKNCLYNAEFSNEIDRYAVYKEGKAVVVFSIYGKSLIQIKGPSNSFITNEVLPVLVLREILLFLEVENSRCGDDFKKTSFNYYNKERGFHRSWKKKILNTLKLKREFIKFVGSIIIGLTVTLFLKFFHNSILMSVDWQVLTEPKRFLFHSFLYVLVLLLIMRVGFMFIIAAVKNINSFKKAWKETALKSGGLPVLGMSIVIILPLVFVMADFAKGGKPYEGNEKIQVLSGF